MEKKELDSYIKAGQICKEVQDNAKKNIKKGQKLLDIAERIEKEIKQLDGELAFPVNLGLNNIAAHYTPSIGDTTILEADVLKVDIGVHVNGFIADSAMTLDFSGKHKELVEASEKALENALKKFQVGTSIGEIGKEIQETIESYGFKPVHNLSGHGLGEFQAHLPPNIPNIARVDLKKIEEGKAYAIEPFASTGKGYVKETQSVEIFELVEPKPIRNAHARKMLLEISKKYSTLPFAERWLEKGFTELQRKFALKELMKAKILGTHPVLKEEEGIFVSQAENTVIIHEGKLIKLL
ncbi:MAG: type II methionyl aminopeptidase [archaeon]|nr:type II methionyl aminopeptidase [archaeon]